MKRPTSVIHPVALAAALCCVPWANAQSPAPSDAAQKAAILASPQWQEIKQEFSRWLSVQIAYTPERSAG